VTLTAIGGSGQPIAATPFEHHVRRGRRDLARAWSRSGPCTVELGEHAGQRERAESEGAAAAVVAHADHRSAD